MGRERHNERGYLAVITMGQVQRGDPEHLCTVLAVAVVPNMKAAKAWYRRTRVEKPWENRQ